MSNKPKEFWIVGIREGAVGCPAVLDKKYLDQYDSTGDDHVHAIEYAEYARVLEAVTSWLDAYEGHGGGNLPADSLRAAITKFHGRKR